MMLTRYAYMLRASIALNQRDLYQRMAVYIVSLFMIISSDFTRI